MVIAHVAFITELSELDHTIEISIMYAAYSL